MFDPERDDDHGARPFYLRLLAVVVISIAGSIALWPAVTGFPAGIDQEKSCVAIIDGWHADRAAPSVSEMAILPALTPAELNDPAAMARWRAKWRAAQASPSVQAANAYQDWVAGTGACVPESRHRLIFSGLGLGGLAVLLGGASIVRRTRTNLRQSPASVAGS